MSRRKNRPIPHEEGVIATIYKKFFLPLMDYKPNQGGQRAWMDELFHLKYRDIKQYKAKRDFRMPGLYLEAPHRKIQGIGYRFVKPDTTIMVRKDHREPLYHVSFFGGQGDKEQVFELDEGQWYAIVSLLESVE